MSDISDLYDDPDAPIIDWRCTVCGSRGAASVGLVRAATARRVLDGKAPTG